jgi:hypothetical protein
VATASVDDHYIVPGLQLAPFRQGEAALLLTPPSSARYSSPPYPAGNHPSLPAVLTPTLPAATHSSPSSRYSPRPSQQYSPRPSQQVLIPPHSRYSPHPHRYSALPFQQVLILTSLTGCSVHPLKIKIIIRYIPPHPLPLGNRPTLSHYPPLLGTHL